MPKNVIVEASINQVLDNPNRDFLNYPIDEAQVQRLMASFQAFGSGEEIDDGLWHAIPARPGKDPKTYELCFGHHRKVAAQRLGYKTIRLEVGSHDDDEMILMLAVENGTQRVSNSAAALDSVAAITRRLVYLLLRAESLEHLCTIMQRSDAEKLFQSQKAFEVARGTLLNGDGVGRDLILRYAPVGSLERAEVTSSLATLKADGGYQRIIEQVTERVRQERAADEVERLRIEALVREAEAKRVREAQEAAERQARELERREAEERERQERARREADEAVWRHQEAIRNKQLELEEQERLKAEKAEEEEREAAAELARLAVEREQRERDQEANEKERLAYNKMRDEISDEQLLAAAKKEEELHDLALKEARADRLLDGRVVPYFRNHYCLSRFREIVTDQNNHHWFPVSEQLDHAKKICELFERDNKKPAAYNLTANYVGSYLRSYLEQNQRATREDEQRALTLSQSFASELKSAIKGSGWIYSATGKLVDLLDKGAVPPADFEEKLRRLEMQATNQIARLRAKSGYVRNVKVIDGEATPIRRPVTHR